MNLNLLMAIIWLIMGVGIIVYDALNPEAPLLRRNWLGISPGWIFLVLVVWNLARWWGARENEKTRRFEEDVAMNRQRDRQRYGTLEVGEQKPDPNFDFSKQSPKEPEGGETGIKPPS